MSRSDDQRSSARAEQLNWLLAASRYWLTGRPADAPAADPPDWHELAYFCYFHDVDPLLHHLGSKSRLDLADRLPDRVRRQWEGAYYRNFVFNTELLDLLERFLSGARSHGLELRVFKGPVTLARGWIDPALRVMADVDLICHREDLPGLADLARTLGFETGEQTATHHLALRHRSLPGALELHFELYEVFARPQALLERLWSEPCWVEVDGRRLPAPTPELGVVIDLAHLLQHDLQLSLRPLLDLSATLWRQRDTLDRVLLAELLEEADLEPEFRCVHFLLTETLDLPGLDGVSPPQSETVPDLEATLLERLLTADRLDRVGAMAGSHRRDGVTATARYLLRRFFPPFAQLQAMTGSRHPVRTLLAYPAHALKTARRALSRWRSGGTRSTGASLKGELFRRRRR